MDLVYIPPENIDDVWSMAEPEIIRALKASGNRSTPDEQKTYMKEAERQLWLVWDGHLLAIVTTMISDRFCTIELCAGHKMSSWLHLLGKIETWAKDKGCEEIEIWGRMGWASNLPDYKKRAVLLTKRLDHGSV